MFMSQGSTLFFKIHSNISTKNAGEKMVVKIMLMLFIEYSILKKRVISNILCILYVYIIFIFIYLFI